MIDLHTHSTASDGRLSPRALVDLAAREGLTALALTDHDTLAGLEEAADRCREKGLRFIPGIELEIQFPAGEFHLLGLGLQKFDGELCQLLEVQAVARQQRNRNLFEALKAWGVPGTWEELLDIAGGPHLGRPHFARWLVKHQKAKNVKEAFDKILGSGAPFYHRKEALPLEAALRAIREAGGRSFVAHPSSLHISLSKLGGYFETWKTLGLDGIEVRHSGLPGRWTRRLEALAKDLNLKTSAGSDFHADGRPDRRLGRTGKTQIIEDEFLDRALG